MQNTLEIELKIRVPDLQPVRNRLQALGARSGGVHHERDAYYNAPHRDFRKTDEALRIRESGGRYTLTYKGPKIAGTGLKARTEYVTGCDSGEAARHILDSLGFIQAAFVEKDREIYTLGDATVALDHVAGLGSFVEIEIIAHDSGADAARRIRKIAKEIGVEWAPITRSYLELLDG